MNTKKQEIMENNNNTNGMETKKEQLVRIIERLCSNILYRRYD